MKLILGTAQFGSNYGINNSTGVLGKKKIDKIIKTAYKNNIRILDTAIEYSESTKILSKLDISKFKIVSKLPFFKDVSKYDLYYRKVIENYFDKLKTKKIYCFLVHNPEKFSGRQLKELFKILQIYKKIGAIEKVGLSIYSPKTLNTSIKYFYPDVVQGPINFFDRRIIKSGWLKKLSNMRIQFHARSVFLQGLFHLNKKKRNIFFSKWKKNFEYFDNWINKTNSSVNETTFSMINKYKKDINHLVIGVDNINHLNDLITCKKNKKIIIPNKLISTDEMLINPFNWKLK